MVNKKTKIIATVGPACNTKEKLWELVQAGAYIFRLNFSHGNHEGHLKVINYIREKITDQTIQLVFVPDKDNVADVFTKPSENTKFHRHTDKVMNGFHNDVDYLFGKSV